jgi:hypothetical protein
VWQVFSVEASLKQLTPKTQLLTRGISFGERNTCHPILLGFFANTVDAHIYIHILYRYELLRETAFKKFYPTGLEIDEVITDASPSTGTPPPTEEYSAFNDTPKCQT